MRVRSDQSPTSGIRLNRSKIAFVARSMTSGASELHRPLPQNCLYVHSKGSKDALRRAAASTRRSSPAVHATHRTVAAWAKGSASATPLSQLLSQVPVRIGLLNPSAANSRTLTLYHLAKVHDTGGRRFLCLAHSSGPVGVLNMSDTVKKQLKKRGKRKHGRC